jgi:hypothetical protein
MPSTYRWTFVPLLVCLTASACAQGDRPASPVAKAKTDGVAGKETMKGPTLSREQYQALVFRVIEGVTRREELTREHLESITGLKLSPKSDATAGYSIAGSGADGGWRWSMSITAHTPISSGLRLMALPSTRDEQGNSPDCTLDYPTFHQRMKRMGFEDSEGFGPLGKGTAWDYRRGSQSVWVKFYYTGEPFAVEGRCIEWLGMEFAMSEKELSHGR